MLEGVENKGILVVPVGSLWLGKPGAKGKPFVGDDVGRLLKLARYLKTPSRD